MKLDLFTESIRRKLESIRPDVTERDWTRMHNSLRQAGLSKPTHAPAWGPGSAQTRLLMAAGLVTAILLALTIWQHREINRLRDTLTLTNPTARPSQPVAARTPAVETTTSPARFDTVYVTRYVRVPATPENSEVAQTLNAAGSRSEEYHWVAPPLPGDSSAVLPNNRTPVPTVGLPGNVLVQPVGSPLTTTNLSQKQRGRLPNAGQPDGETVGGSRTAQRETSGTGPRGQAIPTGVEPESAAGADPAIESEVSQLNLLATTQLRPATVDWSTRLTKKRRLLPSAPVGLAQWQSPESESVSRQATQVRVGVGTDILARGWNAGAVVELLTDRHWALSTGLVRSSQLLGSYLTDDDYEFQTQQSFRREFAPTSDPRRDIYGIGIHTTRYQIPVTVGYRIGLGRSLSLTPSLGTYLDLSNTMQVSFSYRKPLRQGFDQVDLQNNRPCDLVNAYTAGASLEWTHKRWVVQGGLLYANTFYTDPTWFNQPTLGGRLRLLYQF